MIPSMRRYFVLAVSLLFGAFHQSIGFAQNLQPPWIPIAHSVEGNWFYYHAETIKFIGMPPNVVTFNLVSCKEGKCTTSYSRYEAICGSRSITVNNSEPKSVLSGTTIESIIVDAFCGRADPNGYWVTLFAVPDKDNKFTGWWLFNLQSLKKTEQPFHGLTLQMATANIWKAPASAVSFPYLDNSLSEYVVSCLNPSRAVHKKIDAENFSPEIIVQPSTPLWGLTQVLCSGQFPMAEQVPAQLIEPPKDTSSGSLSVDKAKQKCMELGFKSGSENFGSCVLKLSK